MNGPLSIAIICFPTFGGSGVIASEIGLGLRARGHRVSVIARARPVRLEGEPDVAFYEVAAPEPAALAGSSAYAVALASKIIEVCKREAVDVLHVHYAVPHATAAWMARHVLAEEAASSGGPFRSPALVTTLHGTDITLVGADPSYLPITRHSVLASDAVTAPSEFLRAETHRRLGVPSSISIYVIPNFVDTARFRPPTDPAAARRALAEALPGLEAGDAVLFHVSNFRPVKHAPLVVDVLAAVRGDRPAHLVLVGDGPDRPAAQARAAALGLTRHVSFLGERESFHELLGAADVFVLPSETESFGLAALEALSAGVPVVASDVGGLPEVVRAGVTGFLCPAGDVRAFADRVLALVGDPALRRRMGDDARRDVLARFERAPALDRYEAVYRDVTSCSSTRPGPSSPGP